MLVNQQLPVWGVIVTTRSAFHSFVLLCLLSAVCAGCQSFSAMPPWQRGSIYPFSFQPYARNEVPALKELVAEPAFAVYLKTRPYLLGISGNGRYLALIVPERSRETCRLDVFDLRYSSIIQSFNLPLGSASKEPNGDEYIKLVQNTVKTEYQISRGVRPAILIPGYHQELAGHGSLIFEEDDLRVSLTTPAGEQWTVAKGETAEKDEASAYTIPLMPDRQTWGVIIFARNRGDVKIVAVSAVVPRQVYRSPSDQQLAGICQSVLQSSKPCRLLMRGTGENDWFLAGIEKKKTEGDGQTGYAGEAWQFTAGDLSGKRLVIGSKEGIIEGKRHESPTQPVSYYQLVLSAEGDAEEANRLTVDVYNREGNLFRTLEWEWKKGRFQRVTGGS